MIISYTELCDKVGRLIPEKRMRHSAGVAQVSAELADRFLLDADTARYIGIYHDAYRYSCDGSTPAYCREHGIEVFPEEDADPMLLHGALAAIHFDEDAGGEVPLFYKLAVRHHTLGSDGMGVYGAICYIADYTEPGRRHLDDDARRHILSAPSLEEMVIRIMDMQRIYFNEKGMKEAAVSVRLYDKLKSGFRF